MIKITNIPEAIYCKIQRSCLSGMVKVDYIQTYEWKEQIHRFYDVLLRHDFTVVCQDEGRFIITSPGRTYITLYPEDFQEIIFK